MQPEGALKKVYIIKTLSSLMLERDLSIEAFADCKSDQKADERRRGGERGQAEGGRGREKGNTCIECI